MAIPLVSDNALSPPTFSLNTLAQPPSSPRWHSFHIHFRGFFSSITAQVAAAVIPPSATSSKTSSGVPIGVILANIAPLDALISIPKHKSTNGRPKNAGRCPKKSNSDRPSSKNCSLNRDVECPNDFLLIAVASFSHDGSLTIASKEGPEPHRRSEERRVGKECR